MPTFEFHCKRCKKSFDDIQPMVAMKRTSVKDLPKTTRQAKCPDCKTISVDRVFSSSIQFIGTSVQSPEYNPALGQVVKNSSHRKELAKRKGLIEIGNEKPETIHKHFEKAREEKRKKAWEDV